MVIRNLWRRRVRTLLTLGGIAVGIAVVVALMITARGLTSQITAVMSGGGAEITVMQAGVADMQFSALDQDDADIIAALPEVQWVSGLLLEIAPVEERPYFVMVGMDPSSQAIQHFLVREGQHLGGADEILLGRISADFTKRAPATC